jgi:branched-chain amino acid transport system permease protein
MQTTSRIDLRQAVRAGLITGLVALVVSMIGLVELLSNRFLVADIVTLGQLLIFTAPAIISYLMARNSPEQLPVSNILNGLVIGLCSALPLVIFVAFASTFDIRPFFTNVTPGLLEILKFEQSTMTGIFLIITLFAVVGIGGALLNLLPNRYQTPLQIGLVWTFTIGLFSEILSGRLRDFFGAGILKFIFRSKALLPATAILIFVVVALISFLWNERGTGVRERFSNLTPQQEQRMKVGRIVLLVLFLIFLPNLLGTYLSEIMNNVGIYILMGLGLNIVVGFAGLLDLGYVAFFAIGAYTMAVLITEGPLGIGGLSFWAALPFSVAASAIAGIILGIPVLRMRGDYLAIVTLGFGEIIRILALSDLLKPYIGGAQGVLQIPKPSVGDLYLVKPEHLYFIVLVGCLLAWFISSQLSKARLGRQWMALREDEDVAEAMGINLVKTKLLAFAIGAAFSGLGGAIFASKLTSIFPHSFKLEVSINVLSLIIVGGIGSFPGVVVGAIILVGLPELLREFAEYRVLMYGALLVVMMLARPEGFIPSAITKRELHAGENEFQDQAALPVEAGD